MLAVMLGIVAANAQGTGTVVVADGTATNSYVPVYGNWADAYLRCQVIYPESMMAELVGSEIQGVTYYLSSQAAVAWTGTFEVKIGTTASATFDGTAWADVSSFTTVYTGTLDGTGSEMTINFATPFTYTGGNLLIETNQIVKGNYNSCSFYGISSTGSSLQNYSSTSWEAITGTQRNFIPKTGFIVPVSCGTPAFGTIVPSETTAIIPINEPNSATSWSFKYNDGAWTTITDNPYTLTGLTANTNYTVYVRSICGAGDTSMVATANFRTPCATEAFPYSEDFESYTAGSGNFPECWTSISGTNYVEANGTYSTYASQGTKALHMQGPGTVATPVINIAGNDVFISFDMKCENVNSSGDMAIGVALSPAMAESAIWIDTIDAATTYNRYEYTYRNTLNIASGCIVFKQVNTTSTNYYYWIDSLTVVEPPACAKPVGLTLDEATDRSLTLSWTENGTATKWVVKVDDGAWTETTENPYTINGLTANTEYAVSVRAFCDPDTSDAVSGTFRTLCGFETVPYSENFEGISSGLPDCWEQVASNTTRAKWDFNANGHSGNCLNFSDWYAENSRLILPVMDCSSLTADGQLSFYFKNPAISNGMFAHLAIYYRTSSTGEWTAIDGWTLTAANEDWTSADVILPSSANAPYYQISFLATGENTSSRVYMYLDDITIDEAPACVRPSSLAAEATDNSLTLSWTENGSATKWVVKVDDGAWTETTENPYTINGLTANTEYSVSVRSFCDPDTSEAFSATFRTACAAEVVTTDDSFEEEFEGITSGIPSCWAQTDAVWESYTTGYTGRGLYFSDYYSGEDTLITPEFNLSALTNGAQLRFWYKIPQYGYYTYYNATLEVLYRTSTSGEWTVGETLTDVVEDWTEYEYILPASTAAASYQIAFRAVSASSYTDTYVYLDNVTVEAAPTCLRPTSGTITGVTPESAVVTWDAVAGATGYSVAYGETNDVDAATVVSADDATKTLEGLDAETTYYVWVRTVCGSDNANWLALGSFTTEVACAEVVSASVTNATLNEITIGWEIDDSEGYASTAVIVNYKEADASDWTEVVAENNTFTLSGLTEGTAYNFRISNICGTDTADYVTINASTKVCGEVGDGSTVSSYIPSNFYYNYSYSQSIYTAAEVGDIDTIHGISYKYNGTTSPTRTVTVYIADVENAAFEGDFMDITNFTQVATDYAWTVENGWSEIVFDEPFVHQSGKDIVIAIDDNTGTYVSTNPRTFAAHNGNGFRYYNDSSNPDPANITVTGTTETVVADIRFTANCGGSVQPVTCDVPTGLAANNVTENSAVISWTGSAAQYEVELNGQSSTVNTNSYTAQGLTAATAYTVRVRALCDGGLTSDWTAVVNFTTLDEPQPMECNTPTGLAVSNVTENSANISWNEVTIAETFDGEWNLAMGAEDSVHTMITPDATMHMLLNYLGMDFEDVDENVSVAGTLIPVTIEPAAGNQMNVTGSFDMAMYGVDDPVTFHFSTTGTVTSNGMNIEPATINETVRIMNAMDIDYTGTVTFAQPTALPVDGTLTIGIASMNISGYGDTTVNVGIAMTGSVSISMVGTDLTASGSRETTNTYPTYELVVTNVATGVETPITNATTPYALEGLTASTEYTVKVRTHCDENSTSDWSAAVSFTTLNGGGEDPTCDVPTNIVIDQESINTPCAALITWNGTASQYEIEITGGEQPVTTTVSTNSYTFNGVASTTYSVRVRAICDGGVTSDWSAAQSFTTPNGGEPQGIDDVNASYSVNIYPNPAKNTVTISVDGLNGKAQVSVIDMSGRTVMTSTMESDATQLNVSKLAQGTYFVRINGETISTVRKLVVK